MDAAYLDMNKSNFLLSICILYIWGNVYSFQQKQILSHWRYWLKEVHVYCRGFWGHRGTQCHHRPKFLGCLCLIISLKISAVSVACFVLNGCTRRYLDRQSTETRRYFESRLYFANLSTKARSTNKTSFRSLTLNLSFANLRRRKRYLVKDVFVSIYIFTLLITYSNFVVFLHFQMTQIEFIKFFHIIYRKPSLFYSSLRLSSFCSHWLLTTSINAVTLKQMFFFNTFCCWLKNFSCEVERIFQYHLVKLQSRYFSANSIQIKSMEMPDWHSKIPLLSLTKFFELQRKNDFTGPWKGN